MRGARECDVMCDVTMFATSEGMPLRNHYCHVINNQTRKKKSRKNKKNGPGGGDSKLGVYPDSQAPSQDLNVIIILLIS